MLRLLTALVCIVVFWSLMIGWAVMFAFSDGSHAGNVSSILLSPVALMPLPGMILFYAVAFWSLVSVLVLFRDIALCRNAAVGLLVIHWLGALFMLGRDLFAEGGSASIADALRSIPALSLFVVAYGFTQYLICKRLAGGKRVSPNQAEANGTQVTAGRPWKW